MQKEISVYLIDDDADDQQFFAMAVERIDAAIKLEVADTGVQAIERLNSDADFRPDFIFIDMNMPCMNGMECLTDLKKIERLDHTALYMWSTSTHPDITQKCISLGAAGFIKKVPSILSLKEILWNIFYEQKFMIPIWPK